MTHVTCGRRYAEVGYGDMVPQSALGKAWRTQMSTRAVWTVHLEISWEVTHMAFSLKIEIMMVSDDGLYGLWWLVMMEFERLFLGNWIYSRKKKHIPVGSASVWANVGAQQKFVAPPNEWFPGCWQSIHPLKGHWCGDCCGGSFGGVHCHCIGREPQSCGMSPGWSPTVRSVAWWHPHM